MPLSIEGSRTGRKYQETFRNFRTKGSASKLFEDGPGASLGASLLPPSRQSTSRQSTSRQSTSRQSTSRQSTSRQGSEYYTSRSPSSGYKTSKESVDLGPLKPSSSRGSSRSNEQRYLLASGGKKSRERRKTPSKSHEQRPASRSKFSDRSAPMLEISPPSTSIEQSLEGINLSDYMSNLLKKNQNKSRQSTPQSDLGDDDVRPQSVEHLEMQNDIEDNRLRNIMSRGASRKARQQKEFEMDFRPATASDRIARNEVYDSDPHLSIDNVTTKEVDLSALSADFFSPTKKKPPSATKRNDASEDVLLPVRPPSRDPHTTIDYHRRKPQSARAMLEGWQKRMNEMERPPSRQRPPPESLHLYAEGFATRISNVKRPSTAVSPSRHNRQNKNKNKNESDSKLFAAYYMKKDLNGQTSLLRENLRNQSGIKFSTYEGREGRAPSRASRRGRKKRVKEAFANS